MTYQIQRLSLDGKRWFDIGVAFQVFDDAVNQASFWEVSNQHPHRVINTIGNTIVWPED